MSGKACLCEIICCRLLFKVKYSLVDGTQTEPPGREILCSDWLPELLVCQCGRPREGWTHLWQQLWGGKEGQNQAIWQRASVQCVCIWPCYGVRVCFYKSSSTAAENCLVVIQNSVLQSGL